METSFRSLMVRFFTDACVFAPKKLFGLFVDSYTPSPFSSGMKNMAVIWKSCFSSKSRLAQRLTNSCYEDAP